MEGPLIPIKIRDNVGRALASGDTMTPLSVLRSLAVHFPRKYRHRFERFTDDGMGNHRLGLAPVDASREGGEGVLRMPPKKSSPFRGEIRTTSAVDKTSPAPCATLNCSLLIRTPLHLSFATRTIITPTGCAALSWLQSQGALRVIRGGTILMLNTSGRVIHRPDMLESVKIIE